MVRPVPVGILVSGEGTTLQALAELATAGAVPARIVLVVADRPAAPAIDRARRLHLPVVVRPSRGVAPDRWAADVTEQLEAHGAELVIFAGFLAILPPPWVARWRGRAVNVHPSLLPKYGGRGMYGRHVHEAVLAAGDRETGASVHLVTGDVDGGPVLLQERIPVRAGDTPDTLRERLRPVEVRLLAETIRRFADGTPPFRYPDRDASAPGRRAGRDARA